MEKDFDQSPTVKIHLAQGGFENTFGTMFFKRKCPLSIMEK